MPAKPDGLIIGRIVIEKYATEDDIGIWVDTDDGQGDDLALVDVLGMLSFAQHLHGSRIYDYDSDEGDDNA
jgi:hypothetical protein